MACGPTHYGGCECMEAEKDNLRAEVERLQAELSGEVSRLLAVIKEREDAKLQVGELTEERDSLKYEIGGLKDNFKIATEAVTHLEHLADLAEAVFRCGYSTADLGKALAKAGRLKDVKRLHEPNQGGQ